MDTCVLLIIGTMFSGFLLSETVAADLPYTVLIMLRCIPSTPNLFNFYIMKVC